MFNPNKYLGQSKLLFLAGATGIALTAIVIGSALLIKQSDTPSSMVLGENTLRTHKLPQILKSFPIDTNAIKEEIRKVLGSQEKLYGIYVYDLKRKLEIGINEEKVFPPASISKVPVVLLALRDVDAGKLRLVQKFPIKNYNKPYRHDALSQRRQGTQLTLNEYLYYSIVNSDNTANATLEEILGGYEVINKRTKQELGADVFFRHPHDARAKDIGYVFANIYYGSYLEPETNELLLKFLRNTASWLQNGIPAGVPAGTQVAHKTGQLPFYVWEDAGIVYGEQTDYVLVVINEHITYGSAREKTQQISRVIYDSLN